MGTSKELSPELIKVVDEHIDLKGKSYRIVNQKELKDKISKQEFAIERNKLKETNKILKY